VLSAPNVTPRWCVLSRVEPLSQRARAFAGPSSSKQTFDGQIFIEVGPVQVRAIAGDFDVCALSRGSMREAREPSEWNHDGPAVDEVER
jgi:hypothetical protein